MKIFLIYSGTKSNDSLKPVKKFRSDAIKAQGKIEATEFIPNFNPSNTNFWTPDEGMNQPKVKLYQIEDETVHVASHYILPKRNSQLDYRKDISFSASGNPDIFSVGEESELLNQLTNFLHIPFFNYWLHYTN